MERIRRSLKSLDHFGQGINWNIKDQDTCKTELGGVLTLVVVILLSTASWVTGNDIFYKLQPSIFTSVQYYSHRPILTLNKESLPFAVIIQDWYQNNIVNPKYFKMEILRFVINNTSGETSNRTLELENCTSDHFPNLNKEYLQNIGVLNYFCIKQQYGQVSGYFDEEALSFISLRLSMCNREINEDCAPREEIESFISTNSLNFNIYFQNSIFDTQNYQQPQVYFISNLYRIVQLNTFKYYGMFLREEVLSTDSGLIFPDISYLKNLAYDTYETDLSTMDESLSLAEIDIFSSNNQVSFTRSYLKVQDLMANIGGLAQFFFIVSEYLTFKFSSVKRDCDLMNTIHDFNLGFLIENEMHPTISKDLHSQSTYPMNIRANNFLSYEKSKVNIAKLQFSWVEVVSGSLCECIKSKALKQKQSLYYINRKKMNRLLDVSTIIYKLDEYEKLKFLLLKPEQACLLNFISKEIYSVEALSEFTKKSNINWYMKLISSDTKMIDIIKQYEQNLLSSEIPLSDIDMKLFSNLRPDIKSLLTFPLSFNISHYSNAHDFK